MRDLIFQTQPYCRRNAIRQRERKFRTKFLRRSSADASSWTLVHTALQHVITWVTKYVHCPGPKSSRELGNMCFPVPPPPSPSDMNHSRQRSGLLVRSVYISRGMMLMMMMMMMITDYVDTYTHPRVSAHICKCCGHVSDTSHFVGYGLS